MKSSPNGNTVVPIMDDTGIVWIDAGVVAAYRDYAPVVPKRTIDSDSIDIRKTLPQPCQKSDFLPVPSGQIRFLKILQTQCC